MVTAIVLAAGRSTRMGGGTNKQFIDLLGKPLIWYALTAFQQCRLVTEIILVRRPDYAAEATEIAREFSKVVAFAEGGVERQNSVWNGLEKATGEIVAVHDGARPLVTPALIEATVESARQHGTGIAATKVVDTIKEADGKIVSRTVDRTKLWAVQTPQTVRRDLLREAYGAVFKKALIVTDEAAAVELLGHRVDLVETPFLNLKITTPTDLAMAEALLRQRQ
ncbi:MAG: 2-C-methyl-D-erythritol 4-phosphate cytidylyltransferase [Verrucomicrobiota bacterium]